MTSGRPPPGTVLARLDEVPDPGAIVRQFRDGVSLWSALITRAGDEASVFENRCPHAGSPLERPDGRVVVLPGHVLVCAAHGACFALASGAALSGPGSGRALAPIAIRIENGAIILI